MHELGPDFQLGSRACDWESVRNWRREQRSCLLKRRSSLDKGERHRCGELIRAALESESKFLDGCIGFFWSLEGEIDLRPLMRELSDRGNDLALPVIVEKNRPMEFWAWDTKTQMRNQRIWNIPAPVERNPVKPSVLLVPLLGFDEQRHRLGHGGGYYDRTLAIPEQKPLAVGIGYEFGRLETIYPQNHDIAMDMIVTERGIF